MEWEIIIIDQITQHKLCIPKIGHIFVFQPCDVGWKNWEGGRIFDPATYCTLVLEPLALNQDLVIGVHSM